MALATWEARQSQMVSSKAITPLEPHCTQPPRSGQLGPLTREAIQSSVIACSASDEDVLSLVKYLNVKNSRIASGCPFQAQAALGLASVERALRQGLDTSLRDVLYCRARRGCGQLEVIYDQPRTYLERLLLSSLCSACRSIRSRRARRLLRCRTSLGTV